MTAAVSPKAPAAQDSGPALRPAGRDVPQPALAQPEAPPSQPAQVQELTTRQLPLEDGGEASLADRSDPARPPPGRDLATPTAARPLPALPEDFGAKLRNPDGQAFEIELHPRELGRVTFQMRPGPESLTVQIHVERAETQELVRRHLDDLARELRNQGHASVSFSFSGSGQRPADSWGQPTPASAPMEEVAPEPPAALHRRAVTSGIDIRL